MDRLQGFARVGSSTVYLSPANCLTLRAELKAELPAGLLRFTGEALVELASTRSGCRATPHKTWLNPL